jgi:hypothetical protein
MFAGLKTGSTLAPPGRKVCPAGARDQRLRPDIPTQSGREAGCHYCEGPETD